MEEMRQLIGRRQGEGTPRSQSRSVANDSLSSGFARSLELLVSEAESDLTRAISSSENLRDDIKQLTADFKEVRDPGTLMLKPE
jgi:hypothetical protein